MNKFRFACFILFLVGCTSDIPSEKESPDHVYFSKRISLNDSPNGKRKLELVERGNDSSNWNTQILLDFGNCGGGVYAVRGRNLGIKSYWRGNDTIVIETKQEFKPDQKNGWMQCFTQKIKVIYIEK